VLTEPLSPDDTKRLVRRILESGVTTFSQHAREEMAKDRLTDVEVLRVLRSGTCERSDWERGTWRYRMRTQQIVVVVAFRSEHALRVVTAWRVVR